MDINIVYHQLSSIIELLNPILANNSRLLWCPSIQTIILRFTESSLSLRNNFCRESLIKHFCDIGKEFIWQCVELCKIGKAAI